MNSILNILTVARREAEMRLRTRTFIFGTALLVLGIIAIALVPVAVRYIEGATTERVAVYVGTSDVGADPAATLRTLLNAGALGGTSQPGQSTGTAYTVTTVSNLDTARADVTAGRVNAVLALERSASGDLTFTLYTNDASTGRTGQLVRQAANAVAVEDRLDRLGVAAGERATLFGPAAFAVAWADPARSGPTQDSAAMGSSYLLGFGMTVLIFMMIVLYGNWVAMSVVEEKSSRVMEVVLNAATPFELLGGKVLGVGSAAGIQYLAILLAGGVGLLVQDRVATAVLGAAGAVELPEGLTPELLVAFVVYGVLGFVLYAVLYAAAGSLVSRQEDVNAAVMPMTLVSLAGYMIAVYASTGMLDIRAGWMTVLSQIPFISPFLMLSRIAAGEASLPEVVLSILILVASIGVALWAAGRVYAAGVLLYGQRPNMRAVWRLVRTGT